MAEKEPEWPGHKLFGVIICWCATIIFVILFSVFAMDNIGTAAEPISEHGKTIMRWILIDDLILLIGMGFGALAALPVEKK